ncbi:MAG: Uncharacterised protein [SAR116 cluster bacterium]|jgi:hypothetical protein|nr:MAG: Uncharacterised protein [SAR116 cluster bacterium]
MKFLFSFCFLVVSSSPLFAQNFGVIGKASTSGVGVELGYRFSPKFLVKAGYDSFGLDFNANLESDINIDLNSTVNTGTLGLLVDYAIARKLYLSAGLLLNNFETSITGTVIEDYQFGDVIISKENLGSISWQIEPASKIAPYLGIGFGRLLGSSKLINSSIEFGVIYQGSTSVGINANGVFSPNSDPSFSQNLVLEGSLESFTLYPVLKLNLALNLIKK